MPTPKPPLKLILHIGAGKTGTSSIQQVLRHHRDTLAHRGFLYLGMMLEFSPVQTYGWQRAQAMTARPQAEQLRQELADVLGATVAAARRAGVHTLIWSNEQFFRRAGLIQPLVLEMARRGEIDLKVVAYVRRHDAWARSAYTQWGIKHKTYAGPLLGFDEWIETYPPLFMPSLRSWVKSAPEALVVRNFDACGDVVHDFCHLCGLPDEVAGAGVRANESLSPESTYLRAMFNAHQPTSVRVKAFTEALGIRLDRPQTPTEALATLLPTQEALRRIHEHTREDRQAIDALLASQGQPPLPTNPLNVKALSVDTDKLLNALCQIVMHQSTRISELEARLGLESAPDKATAAKAAPQRHGRDDAERQAAKETARQARKDQRRAERAAAAPDAGQAAAAQTAG